MSVNRLQATVKDREDCGAIVHGVAMTLLSDKRPTYIHKLLSFSFVV